jgi:Arc/MetJ-type ribon-helix-helix transcriptional regulator
MELMLAPETKKIIDERVKSGEFASAEEMVSVAIHRLVDPAAFGDFAPGELDRLLAEGESSGPPIPFETLKANLQTFKESFTLDRK